MKNGGKNKSVAFIILVSVIKGVHGIVRGVASEDMVFSNKINQVPMLLEIHG